MKAAKRDAKILAARARDEKLFAAVSEEYRPKQLTSSTRQTAIWMQNCLTLEEQKLKKLAKQAEINKQRAKLAEKFKYEIINGDLSSLPIGLTRIR